jgi:CubicO group peptidase (beta-lactamase class C family)
MTSRLAALAAVLACGAALAGMADIGNTADTDRIASEPAAVASLLGRAAETFGAPGMAVSVVRDGKLVYAGGVGTTGNGTGRRVDADTLFHIGSVSKAFTAAALALLVDEGRIGWDDAVIDHLPEFRMHDPWVTREFTIRDLLTHRSGLPPGAGDLLIFPDGRSTPSDILRALRHLEPASSFRSQFDYDNLLYIVAGEVIARVANMPFQNFLEMRLLAPLGMADCVASDDRILPDAPVAIPHMKVEGEIESTTTRLTPTVAAAGGIVCSARGMAAWMAFVLGEGEAAEGERLVSEAQFRELIRPITLSSVPAYLAEHAGTSLRAYALGWGVSTFHGEPMLSHGGGVWGMTSFIAVLPQSGLAVFASNNLMTAAPRALVYAVMEQALADPAAADRKDWIDILDRLATERQSEAEKAVAEAWESRAAESGPSLPLDHYTGTYRDPWYGDVRIRLTEDGELWFESQRNEPLRGPLVHFQYDTFVARWTDRRLMADAYVTFYIGPEGDIEHVGMKAVSPATDFSFDFHDLELRPVPPPSSGR